MGVQEIMDNFLHIEVEVSPDVQEIVLLSLEVSIEVSEIGPIRASGNNRTVQKAKNLIPASGPLGFE